MRVLILALLLFLAQNQGLSQVFSPSIKRSFGTSFLFSGERNIDNVSYKGGRIFSYDLEYTYLHDNRSYYSGYFLGFTTGLKYQTTTNQLRYNNVVYQDRTTSLAVPALLAYKVYEWGNVLRVGLVGSKDLKYMADPNYMLTPRDYHLDAYLSFGFDNRFGRYRTDSWLYTIEIFGQYNLLNHTYNSSGVYGTRLFRFGGKVGIAYQFDYYHYRKWYNNY